VGCASCGTVRQRLIHLSKECEEEIGRQLLNFLGLSLRGRLNMAVGVGELQLIVLLGGVFEK